MKEITLLNRKEVFDISKIVADEDYIKAITCSKILYDGDRGNPIFLFKLIPYFYV